MALVPIKAVGLGPNKCKCHAHLFTAHPSLKLSHIHTQVFYNFYVSYVFWGFEKTQEQ